MSAMVVGLGASALLVANEVSSGDAKTLGGLITGANPPAAHQALIRAGLMLAGVVALAVAAGQSSPWPGIATAILLGLWVLWLLHTFGQAQTKTAASTSQGTVLA